MNKEIDNLCIELGNYIVETGQTVRQTAKQYNMSKSTVHIYVTKKLREISPTLAAKVNLVLQLNKSQRHIRGGNATKKKYEKLKMIDI